MKQRKPRRDKIVIKPIKPIKPLSVEDLQACTSIKLYGEAEREKQRKRVEKEWNRPRYGCWIDEPNVRDWDGDRYFRATKNKISVGGGHFCDCGIVNFFDCPGPCRAQYMRYSDSATGVLAYLVAALYKGK